MGDHGKRLNQSPKALGLLKTFFDMILGICCVSLFTLVFSNPFPGHWCLWKQGILDQDISWGNVLCLTEDEHDIDMEKQPCIEQLL